MFNSTARQAREFGSGCNEEARMQQCIEVVREIRKEEMQIEKPVGSPNRNLRIAFIGGRGVVSKYSGIETYYEEVGKHLASSGHEIVVYCRTYFTPALDRHNGMKIIRIATLRRKHLETFIHSLLSTLHALFSHYDVVHYHTLGPALFSLIPRIFGMKTVVTVQGLDWQRSKWSSFARWFLRLCETASVRFPNSTIVVSKTLNDYYWKKYSTHTTYIPNGLTMPSTRSANQILRIGLSPRKYILFLGRLSPEKNVHLLIQAYERIKTSVKLVIAGGTSHTEGYVEKLKEHQCDRICFLNWVDGEILEELLSNALLFVLPSDIEGLSLALLEAMGYGNCVLTSDIPENVELVDGVGYTFIRGDVGDLERMLRLLLTREDLRKRAGRDARARVQHDYLWTRVASQTELLYYQVLGGGHHRHFYTAAGGLQVNSPPV